MLPLYLLTQSASSPGPANKLTNSLPQAHENISSRPLREAADTVEVSWPALPTSVSNAGSKLPLSSAVRTIRPNVSTRVVPKNCADLETRELVDTSCVGAKRRWNAPFIFSLGEQAEQMMKLSQDDTCATVYATFSRRKNLWKTWLQAQSHSDRIHFRMVHLPREDPGDNQPFFFFFFWW